MVARGSLVTRWKLFSARVFDALVSRAVAAERLRTDEALRIAGDRLQLDSDRMLALHRASTVLAGQKGDPSAVFDEVLSSAVTSSTW